MGVRWRTGGCVRVFQTGVIASGVRGYISVICRNVHCELPQCITSVCMLVGGCNLGMPLSLFVLQS